ncbi:hypothetical protein ACXN5S_00625 [Pseudoroseicyclus sp. H15]
MLRPSILAAPLVAVAYLAGPLMAQDALNGWEARTTLENYYSALSDGSYQQAYGMWQGDGEASGLSYDDLAAGFAETESVQVFTAAPEMEGAAGSIYATVPVRIEAELEDGTQQHFAGSYVLRTANGVEGAEPGWFIESAEITETQ